jgi:hypothetical protein
MGKPKYQDDLSTPTFHRSNDSDMRHVLPQYELEDPLGSMPSSGATGVTSRFEPYKFVVVYR